MSCGDTRTNHPLAEAACAGVNIPEDFYLQDHGGFDDENLPAPGAEIESGFFIFWRELIEEPPDEQPPLDLVCQVLRFPTRQAAQEFFEQMDDRPLPLVTGLFREPDIREAVPAALPVGSGPPSSARLFALEAGRRSGAPGPVYALVVADGHLVHTVLVDRPRDPLTPDEAIAFFDQLFEPARAFRP